MGGQEEVDEKEAKLQKGQLRWALLVALPVAVAAVCAARPDIRWVILELCWNLLLPTSLYLGFLRFGPEQKGPKAPGPLRFLPSQLRMFVVFICLPGMGFFNWDLRKRAFTAMGPASNATVFAGASAKDFAKAVASFVLLPTISMISEAHQSGNHARVIQIVGTSLGIALFAGVATQLYVMLCAKSVMSIFEGSQALRPDAVDLFRRFCLAFPCSVLNDTMMGILGAVQEYMLIGECVLPSQTFALCAVFLVRNDFIDLHGLILTIACNEVVLFLILSQYVLALIRKNRAAMLAAAVADEPKESARATGIVEVLQPSREVVWEMLKASGNTGLRNMALRLQGFCCGMSAVRLGNVQGSTYALQQQLKAFLAGPAGSTGLFTANVAPMLLSINALGTFVKSVKVIFGMLIFFSAVWFYCAALGGPMRVLRFGGVLATPIGANSTGWNASANFSTVLGNQTRPPGVEGEVEDYLEVLTPLNHWLWAAASIANEVAAPFDGVLMVLGAYSYLGFLYGGDLLLLLPVLYLVTGGDSQQCPLPERWAPPGCNSFTGVSLAALLWGLVRLVGLLSAIFGEHVPRLRRRILYLTTACCKELVLGYLAARCEVSEEEVAELKEKHRGNLFYRFRNEAPMGKWARQHHTSTEALTELAAELKKRGDPDLLAAGTRHFELYGDWM